MRSAFQFFIFLVSFGLGPAVLLGLDSMIDAFEEIHGDTALPVFGMTFDDVESTFGPREQTSTGNYDWHRGIDVDGVEGDDILAAYDGVFYDYRFTDRGGYIVILRHELPSTANLLGSTNSRVFYTWYVHLQDDGIDDNGIGTDDIVDDWIAYVDDSANAEPIAAGQHIGEMGDTGSPGGGASYADHLHFEVRWGANSSLEFQLDNVGTTTQWGFDPHIHPLFLYEPYTYGSNGASSYLQEIELDAPIESDSDITLNYTTNDDMPVLNRVEAAIVPEGGGSAVEEHTLDFNLREGYDASDLASLDTQNPDDSPYMNPLPFTDSEILYDTQLIVPSEWTDGYLNSGYNLEVTFTDIWGNSEVFSTSLTAIPEPRLAGALLGLAALGGVCWRRRQNYKS